MPTPAYLEFYDGQGGSGTWECTGGNENGGFAYSDSYYDPDTGDYWVSASSTSYGYQVTCEPIEG